MKTIICPIDFSSNSENAVNYAASLSETFASILILVHAYETPVMFTEQPFTTIQLADEELRLASEKKLEHLKLQLQKQYNTIKIDYLLTEGTSSDQLVAVADREKADLIVMGTTGLTKLERLLMGSTTAGTIRKAHCPVLSIPKNAKFRGINKIIFSTDLHEDNIGAAISISKFAKHFDSEIIFLYVDDKHLIHNDEEIVQMTEKIRTRIRYPKISGFISKNPLIHHGIDYFLKKHPADILVMFTHTRHFPESLFHPSLTKIMSHQTRIPLLSMKFSDEAIISNL
jgi:nucleotide-binding universal stress UspA family protein